MAYNAWSVVFGEQPSAAKWNILGANDASFNDGTGIGSSTILARHLAAAGPQGMINGKLSVTVSSFNITVAIKTLAGTDPSSTDPVRIIINGVMRSITSALSVTKNAGTNWFNLGSNVLEQEADFFVYLGYNATDGVVVGFARICDARQYSRFNTTSTENNYCAISTITNAASTDPYTVVGRFGATLSDVGGSGRWVVPTFTPTNLIHHPIFETRWLTWNAVYGGSASMTFTSVSDQSRYKLSYDKLFLKDEATGTVGGTPDAAILITNRVFNSADSWGGGILVVDNSQQRPGIMRAQATGSIEIYRDGASNWSAGSGRGFRYNVFMDIA